jgi:hypothetical protein
MASKPVIEVVQRDALEEETPLCIKPKSADFIMKEAAALEVIAISFMKLQQETRRPCLHQETTMQPAQITKATPTITATKIATIIIIAIMIILIATTTTIIIVITTIIM